MIYYYINKCPDGSVTIETSNFRLRGVTEYPDMQGQEEIKIIMKTPGDDIGELGELWVNFIENELELVTSKDLFFHAIDDMGNYIGFVSSEDDPVTVFVPSTGIAVNEKYLNDGFIEVDIVDDIGQQREFETLVDNSEYRYVPKLVTKGKHNTTDYLFNFEKGIWELSLEMYKREKIYAMNLNTSNYVDNVYFRGYCRLEVDSFDLQVTEATKVLDGERSTFIRSLARSRGRDEKPEELAEKIINRHKAYHNDLGRVLGDINKAKKEINNCSTLEEVDQVEIPGVKNDRNIC